MPHRQAAVNSQAPGIKDESHLVPDKELIATLVAHGQPIWAAKEILTSPQARFNAFRFWCDVQDAGEGDKEAKMRIDFITSQWQKLRQEELLSDDPHRMHTEIVDPRSLL